VDIAILGPFAVTGGGRPLPLARYKQRLLLATLALCAGDVVPVDRLVEILWEGTPPQTARKQIHGYVSALRALLVLAGEDASALQTCATGYRLVLPQAKVDLSRFTEQTATADRQRRAGQRDEASRTLRDALALWRGDALVGLRGRFVETERRRLEELRLTALHHRMDLDLSLGRHADLVPELTGLLDAHPLHEGLRTRLMLALQRTGRNADALAVGREGRRISIEELGIEPADPLRTVELAILRGEAAGEPVVPGPAIVEGPVAVTGAHRPCQLPRALPELVGRDGALAQVHALLTSPAATAAVIVTAMPGAGSSSLALHAAQQARDRYPDGQLYLRMRRDGGRPVDPVSALAAALRALAPTQPTPSTLDECACRYRELLAERRVLVVLDDVVNERQVAPLLPGGDRSTALVASHSWLPGLAAARRMELELFTLGQALALLGREAGAERVAAEPVAARRVIRLCGYLPLAVGIAATRLATRPQWTVQHLAETLAPQQRRLAALAAGELQVRASLRAGYSAAPVPAQQALRVLSLLPGEGLPRGLAVQALHGRMADPEQAIEELADLHLVMVERCHPGEHGYRLHPLVRLFAQEQALCETREQALAGPGPTVSRPGGADQASFSPGWPSSTANRLATEDVTFAGSDWKADETVTNSAVN